MTSIKKNFIYNILYQVLVVLLPFITVPYVSRVLGKDGVGIYSFTYSIVNYFMLITLLGINNYGNRMIAKVRDDKNELSKTFLSIYSIQLISGLIMLIAYAIYMLFINKNYVLVSWIQIIYLFSAILDINWFFFGLEEFKITVTRNTVIKILSLVSIFLFVKEKSDVPIYVLILSISALLSQVLLFPFLIKRIKIIKINIQDIKKHIKPIFILFFPVIVISLYTVMDKIMLGILSSVSYVGIYEQADKIIKIPLCIITALGTVMLPRISSLVSQNKKDQVIDYIEKSVRFMMMLAFPMWLGIVAIGERFIPLFLGEDFIEASEIVKYMSIVIIFISFANITRTQYLIPYERDKEYIVSTSIGAIINLILNMLLIPKYNAIGACIGTIGAELSVMAYQSFALRKELPILKYFMISLKYCIFSIIMYFVIIQFNYMGLNDIITIILQLAVGVMLYGLLNLRYLLSVGKTELSKFKKN